MIEKLFDTTLNTVGRLTDLLRSGQAESLSEYVSATRVEPIAIIDGSLRNNDAIVDIMHNVNVLFCGYYLQAIAISSNVGDIDTQQVLDKLSTKRSKSLAAARGFETAYNGESYNFGLRKVIEPGMATGKAGTDLVMSAERRRMYSDTDQEGVTTTSGGREGSKSLVAESNLSVGRLLDVEITDGERTANISVTVRLNVNSTRSKDMVDLMAVLGSDKSAKHRWNQFRDGEIEFWNDLVLCRDIIDSHRNARMRDDKDILNTMIKRRQSNRFAGVLSGDMSVNNASSIYVMSHTTARALETRIGGSLDSMRVRERLMAESLAMVYVVVDTEADMVTTYIRGLDTPSETTFKEIKSSNKGSGPDVGEILKAYQLGNAPSF